MSFQVILTDNAKANLRLYTRRLPIAPKTKYKGISATKSILPEEVLDRFLE